MKNEPLLKQSEIRDEWDKEFATLLLDIIKRNFGIEREEIMKTKICVRCKKEFPIMPLIDWEFVQLKRDKCLECVPYKKRKSYPKRVII